MRVLRWHGRGDIRLEQVEEPGPPPPGFATVEVSLCGICGSDLTEFKSGPAMISPRPHPLSGQAPPLTLGHELAGRVAAVAAGSALATGDRVSADACWRCGRCAQCLAGDYHLCRYGGSLGLHSDGAFAPLVQLPEYMLVPLPDQVEDERGALLEPLAVGLHALDRGGLRAAEDVAAIGFGPIGACAALCARAQGARVTVVERDPSRLAKAAAMGFATLEAGEELPRRLRKLLGSGGADLVVESTGSPAVLAAAIECARRGGRISVVGLPVGLSEIDLRRLVLFERSAVGSLGYRGDLPRVARMLADGSLDVSGLVAETIALEDAPAAFAELAGHPDERIKVLVDPR
jgi:(R,R)-butanediol dehydrogenase/meso-butanediol dehydrogenase/diacetyl reductase